MTFDEFLALGGKDRAWFDALPAAEQDRVREWFKQGATLNDDALIAARFQAVERGTPAASITPTAQTVAAPGPSAYGPGVQAEPAVSEPSTEPPVPQLSLADSRTNAFLIDEAFAALESTTFQLTAPKGGTQSTVSQVPGGGLGLGSAFNAISSVTGLQPEQGTNVNSFITGLWSNPGDTVTELQNKLIAAGYLDPEKDDVLAGLMTDDMQFALLRAINQSQKAESPLLDFLNKRAGLFKKDEEESEEETFAEMAQDQYKRSLLGVYMENWGTAPPPGYVDRIAASGMNVYEFNAHERAKPAFQSSPVFHMERLSLEADLANTFGALG